MPPMDSYLPSAQAHYPEAGSIGGLQQREQSPIGSQMNARANLQATLHESISRLEARLQPVLSPRNDPPQPVNGIDKAAVRNLNLAQEMNSANADLENMISWLNNITGRIEL